MARRRNGLLRKIKWLLTGLLIGCTAPPLPPAAMTACATPRLFYVVSHGWHTGVVVSREDVIGMAPELADDFKTGRYLEIGWGDEQFYQTPVFSLSLALRALLWPTATVLHVVAVPDRPQDYFPASEVIAITVPPVGYTGLLAFIAGSFKRTAGHEIIPLGPGLYGVSQFYPAQGVFHAGNTCNTWVAKALAATGYPLADPKTITAAGLLSQLPRGFNTQPCFSVR